MKTKPSSKNKRISKGENSGFEKDFTEFKTLLEQSKRILISTHQLPDGDGLGAELALFQYLKKARKACRVYNPDPLPMRYQFLDPKKQILLGPGEVEFWDTCDLWVIVDTNDPRRLGSLWPELSLRSKKIVFLDHHPEIEAATPVSELKYPRHAMLVSDLTSSSIGELLYHLFTELNLSPINLDVALGIYISIMTDTNSFRYSRTTPAAHRIAAEMIEHGVNPEEVYQSIFSSKEVSHLRLLGNMLQNVNVTARGKLAWLEMSAEIRKEHRATSDDTQSFLNLLLLLKDAEVVCLFREEDDGRVRASIKSKGKIVINKVAMEMGGGGHEFAAGFANYGPIHKTVSAAIERLTNTIDQFERFGK
jgi:bifunctional oligoribonuclease and PAP phosphatase NrnA